MAASPNIKDPSRSTLASHSSPSESFEDLTTSQEFSSEAKGFAQNFATRAKLHRELLRHEKENSYRSVALLQAFFPAALGQKPPEALENLATLVKHGKSLREAFGGIASHEQQEVQKRVGPFLEEVFSLAQTQDETSFWEGALHLGIRLKQSKKLEAGASVLGMLSQGEVPPEVKQKATAEYNALISKGSSGLRAEHILTNLVDQSSNYRTIVPIIGASALGQIAGATVLGRLAGSSSAGFFTRNFGARLLSGTTSFLVETPIFAVGARYFNGKTDTPVMDDIWSAGLSLGAMRAFGFLGNQSILKLHRVNELGAATRLTGFSKFSHAAVPQAAMFLGMLGAHELEKRWNLRPRIEGETTVADILGSMVSLQVGTNLGGRFLGHEFAAFQREMGVRTNIFTKYGETQQTPIERPLSVLSRPISEGRTGLTIHASLTPGLTGKFFPAVEMISSKPMLMVDSSGGTRGGSGKGPTASEFKIGEKNSSESIRTVDSINNQAIETLELQMRPGAVSGGGFLGPKESLREVLVADNDFVLSRGLTHKKIAEGVDTLLAISPITINLGKSREVSEQPITHYLGFRFRVEAQLLERGEFSPFLDEANPYALEYTIANHNTGKEFRLSTLQLVLIEKYGFYGGKHSPHRLEPSQILETLSFLTPIQIEAPTGIGIPAYFDSIERGYFPKNLYQPDHVMVTGPAARTEPEEGPHFGLPFSPGSQLWFEVWSEQVAGGDEAAWYAYQQFLKTDFQGRRLLEEAVKQYERALEAEGFPALHDSLGIGKETQAEVLSSIFLMAAAQKPEARDSLGIRSFLDPAQKVQFDTDGLGQYFQHPLRHLLASGRGERLSVENQEALVQAAHLDLVLLSVLALMAARGQPWAIRGLKQVERNHNAEADAWRTERNTLREPARLGTDLGGGGHSQDPRHQALGTVADGSAREAKDSAPPLMRSEMEAYSQEIAWLIQQVSVGDYHALVSLAQLAKRITEAQLGLEKLVRTYDGGRYVAQLAVAGDSSCQQAIIKVAQTDSSVRALLLTLRDQGHGWAAEALVQGVLPPTSRAAVWIPLAEKNPQAVQNLGEMADRGDPVAQEALRTMSAAHHIAFAGTAPGCVFALRTMKKWQNQEAAEGMRTASIDAYRYNPDRPGTYSFVVLSVLAEGKNILALEELAHRAVYDSEAANFLASLVDQEDLDARRAFQPLDLSRLFPDGALAPHHIANLYRYWEAGNTWAGDRLSLDTLKGFQLNPIVKTPDLYSHHLASIILLAHARNPRANTFLDALHKARFVLKDKEKLERALETAAYSLPVFRAMVGLHLRGHRWPEKILRGLDLKKFQIEAVNNHRALDAFISLKNNIGHASAEAALIQLFDLVLKFGLGTSLRVYDYASERELIGEMGKIPPYRRAAKADQWYRWALRVYSRDAGFPDLEGRIHRGLDPAGMLAVPNTREKVEEIAHALGASMGKVEFLHRNLTGDIGENTLRLANMDTPEALTGMILAHLTVEGEKTPQEFLEDTARLLRDLDEAATDPQAAALAAKHELAQRASGRSVSPDIQRLAGDVALLFSVDLMAAMIGFEQDGEVRRDFWMGLAEENPSLKDKIWEIRRVFAEVEATKRLNSPVLSGLMEHCFGQVKIEASRSLLGTLLWQRILEQSGRSKKFNIAEEAKAILQELELEGEGAEQAAGVKPEWIIGKMLTGKFNLHSRPADQTQPVKFALPKVLEGVAAQQPEDLPSSFDFRSIFSDARDLEVFLKEVED